jgi:hypothetical protein
VIESPEILLGPDTMLHSGDTLYITVENVYDSIRWDNGCTDPSLCFIASEEGPLSSKISAEVFHRGCSGSDQMYISILTKGIESEDDHRKKLNIYPNPAKDNFRIEWGESLDPDRFILYNSHGSVAYIIDHLPDLSVDVNCSSLPPGMYFLRIFTEDPFTVKVLVE